MIKFLLLFSLFLNITHTSIMDIEDEYHHHTLTEYVMDEHIADESDDLCDMHHLFHFIAIFDRPNIDLNILIYSEQSTQKPVLYSPPLKNSITKPPIA